MRRMLRPQRKARRKALSNNSVKAIWLPDWKSYSLPSNYKFLRTIYDWYGFLNKLWVICYISVRANFVLHSRYTFWPNIENNDGVRFDQRLSPILCICPTFYCNNGSITTRCDCWWTVLWIQQITRSTPLILHYTIISKTMPVTTWKWLEQYCDSMLTV